jgi:hypothetical protein
MELGRADLLADLNILEAFRCFHHHRFMSGS